MGRQNERTGPLGCGHSRGLFLWFQEVPSKVLGEMLGESLSQLKSWSQVVSSSPIWTLTERTPSPFKVLPRQVVVLRNRLPCKGSRGTKRT